MSMHAEPITDTQTQQLEPTFTGFPVPSRTALAVVPESSPAGMLAYAMQSGATIADLRELYALKQEWDKDEARKAYHLALSDFKAEPLSITKDKLVSIKHKDGNGRTEYTHATLGNVVATIAPALGRHKLSHSWGVRREGDRVHVTCKLTHALGHSEEITLDGALDTSGSKNNIQAIGSTITYLERYTILAITGLATEDQDDDGGGGDGPEDGALTKAQALAADWLQTIAECPDLPTLTARKVECVKAYGHADKVPASLKQAFGSRTKALTP